MAATADRTRFTTEKVDVDHEHDCQAIAANSQGLIGKSSLLAFLFYFFLDPVAIAMADPRAARVFAALAAQTHQVPTRDCLWYDG